MNSVERVVLDDLKMNLIGALVVLVLAASFSGTLEIPFRLTKANSESSHNDLGMVRASKILIQRSQSGLTITVDTHTYPLKDSEKALGGLNPALKAVLAVERGSGLTYDQLVEILSQLKNRGVTNVSVIVSKQ